MDANHRNTGKDDWAKIQKGKSKSQESRIKSQEPRLGAVSVAPAVAGGGWKTPLGSLWAIIGYTNAISF